MARLFNSLTSCAKKMTAGERRVALRLESYLSDDCLVWYDVPVGRNHRHPDFIIIDPSQGLIFLEVKDWKLSTLRQVNPEHVILETESGTKCEINPIEQVTRYSRDIINLLSQDPKLQQSGDYQGKLKIAWAYGVIFTNITRKQLESLSPDGSINTLFPPRLTLCQDEIAESVSSDSFRKKIAGLFTTSFRPPVCIQTRDLIRQHIFPEVVIRPRKIKSDVLNVMDIQQELLARNIGEGHRVIHGVAGSGKTLILLYRSQYLAECSDRPTLILCYNITLANYIRECIAERGLSNKIHVYHFHAWCAAVVRKFNLAVSGEADEYFDNSFDALEYAVNKGNITETEYSSVLIDEGHDFDSRWLSVISKLFDNRTHSLLLMYDDAQSLYRRERGLNFSLASVGIQAQGRTSILRINYRNSRRILNFAYAFSRDYFEKHHNKEVPLIPPEAYGDEGTAPDIFHCSSKQDEAQRVADWIKEKYEISGHWGDIAVLCPTKYSVDILIELLDEQDIPSAAGFTSADKRNFSQRQEAVHLLTFQSSKGLEFPFVAVVNASYVHASSQDETGSIPALYVAFTRATQELLVTSYTENSISRHLAAFI